MNFIKEGKWAKMNRVNELIKEYCPDGVEIRCLEDCCNLLDKKRKPITKAAREAGEYPYYGANGIQDYVANYIFDGTFVLVGEDGSVITKSGTPVVTWAEGKIWVNNHAHIIEEKDGVMLRYLYHYLQTIDVTSLIHGNIPKLTGGDFKALKIAVPPLEVQREIVRVLDYFTLLTAELTDKLMAEFTARKKQYEFYRDRLLTFDPLGGEISEIAWKKLGEICDIISGFPFDSTQFCNSGVKLLRGMNVKRGFLDFSDSNNKYWRSIDGVEKYLLRDGDIIVAMDGSLVGKSFGIVSEKQLPLLLVQRVARVRAIQGNVRYIYHCISGRFSNYVDIKKTEGAVPHISLKDILNFQIPFPELQIQNRIAHVLDNFNAICTDLNIGLPAEIEDRQKQYEYYRDKLLSFKEVSESIGK